MRNVESTLIALTVVAATLLAPTPARALQLVPNFGFDTGTTGWTKCCAALGVATWDGTRDAWDSGLSGSGKLTHTADPPADSLTLSRCLTGPDVTPGTKLFFGVKLRFAEGQTSEGIASIVVRFLSGANCSGTSILALGKGYAAVNATRGVWLAVEENPATAPTVPAGAQSVRVSVEVTKTSAGTLTVNFDDVYVAPVGTPLCDGLPATQVGGPDADFINGTDASDVIVGKGNIDWIDGHGGNDRLCGGPGDDVLYGGPGDDRLFGEGGKDTLLGVAGDDLLSGAGNNDTLEGGTGSDVLRGGSGVDSCTDADPGTILRKCEAPPAG